MLFFFGIEHVAHCSDSSPVHSDVDGDSGGKCPAWPCNQCLAVLATCSYPNAAGNFLDPARMHFNSETGSMRDLMKIFAATDCTAHRCTSPTTPHRTRDDTPLVREGGHENVSAKQRVDVSYLNCSESAPCSSQSAHIPHTESTSPRTTGAPPAVKFKVPGKGRARRQLLSI